MKKTLLSLIALFICAIAFAYDAKIDGIYYNLNNENKTAEVTNQSSSSSNYSGVTTITIPSSVTYNSETYNVTSIGNYAFHYCSSLTSITIPNSVTEIGNGAFYKCKSLASITIPNSVTSIGDYAFSECESLTSITIPNSVTEIGHFAFSLCLSLTSISIPNSVTSIGDGAFKWTQWLEKQPNGCLYVGSCLYIYIGSMSENTHIDIKEGTTQICSSAFSGCSSLTSITIPNSVTSIGERAFYKCSSLISISIPNSVTSIANEVFSYCSTLTSITIPNSVTEIDSEAFWYCSSLASITIPNSVTEIGERAFKDCSLTSVHWNAKNCSDFYSKPFGTNITSFTFGDSVQYIPAYLCYKMSELTSITIPNSVTSISNNAFSDCSSLTSITIPNSVTEIGNGVFEACTSLTSITSPATIFNQGTGSTILQKVHVNAGELNENGFNFINSSEKSLHTIDLSGATNTTINDMTFYNYYKLENLTLPINTESIGYKAFADCIKLKSITFPASLKNIDDFAFSNCINIDTIKVDAIEPPTITGTTFDKVSRDIEFFVPEEALNAYAEHEYWREFTPKVPDNIENNESMNAEIFTQNGTLHIDGITTDYQIYTTTGRLIYSGNASTLSLARGIYLITINGETQKIVL